MDWPSRNPLPLARRVVSRDFFVGFTNVLVNAAREGGGNRGMEGGYRVVAREEFARAFVVGETPHDAALDALLARECEAAFAEDAAPFAGWEFRAEARKLSLTERSAGAAAARVVVEEEAATKRIREIRRRMFVYPEDWNGISPWDGENPAGKRAFDEVWAALEAVLGEWGDGGNRRDAPAARAELQMTAHEFAALAAAVACA